MPSYDRLRPLSYAIIGFLTIAATGAGLWYYLTHRPPQLDDTMLKIFSEIDLVQMYTQEVETEADISGRKLYVSGRYMNNRRDGKYESLSTTTLVLPDDPPGDTSRSFTLHNISIGDDVYTKVETQSEMLQTTIPHGPSWHRFKRTAIPAEFREISIAGPILDNLKILSENGRFIELIENGPEEEVDGEMLTRYSFRISGEMPEETGTLMAVLQRLGPDGRIDIWVDDERSIVRQMRLESAEYRSTVRIRDVHSELRIEPPISSQAGATL